jgi:alpha-ketoglutarate-dependent taurine dioxygenase
MTALSANLNPLRPFGLLIEPERPGTDVRQLSLAALREQLARHRLLVLRGFAPFASQDELSDYCATWGPLLHWDFGTVFEVVEKDNPNNYLFTSGSVPYHYDGAFAKQVPWLQIFHCVEATGHGRGGETIFCDTVAVWGDAPPDVREKWQRIEIEYATDKVAHYGGRFRAKLVGKHPLTGATTLRFAEPANADTVRLNTPELHVFGLGEAEIPAFFADLLRRLYDPANVYAHAWRPGDLVITDNHALLHGRTPYKSKQPRRLWRVHVL